MEFENGQIRTVQLRNMLNIYDLSASQAPQTIRIFSECFTLFNCMAQRFRREKHSHKSEAMIQLL